MELVLLGGQRFLNFDMQDLLSCRKCPRIVKNFDKLKKSHSYCLNRPIIPTTRSNSTICEIRAGGNTEFKGIYSMTKQKSIQCEGSHSYYSLFIIVWPNFFFHSQLTQMLVFNYIFILLISINRLTLFALTI